MIKRLINKLIIKFIVKQINKYQNQLNIYLMKKNWRTTAAGIAAGLLYLGVKLLTKQPITAEDITLAMSMAGIGALAKDYNVTGGAKILLFCLLIPFASSAQTFTVSKEVVQKSLTAPHQRSITQSASNDTRFSGFSTQLSFTQISYADNAWHLGNSFTIGEAYLWSKSEGTWNPDSSITLSPKFSFGFGVNYGLSVNDAGTLEGSLPVGAVVLYSNLGAFAGYDLLNQVPLVGVTYSLPAFPVLKGSTRFSKLPK
jgi:hypothetical protein